MTQTLLRLMVAAALSGGVFAATAQAPAQNESLPADSSRQILDRIVKSKTPVLIDFWAPWCRPCRMLAPILQKVEKQYRGKLTVMKVNIDIHRGIAGYFGVQSIPAVFLVKNRTAVNRLLGLQPEEAYTKAIDDMLAMKVPDPPADSAAQQKPPKNAPM